MALSRALGADLICFNQPRGFGTCDEPGVVVGHFHGQQIKPHVTSLRWIPFDGEGHVCIALAHVKRQKSDKERRKVVNGVWDAVLAIQKRREDLYNERKLRRFASKKKKSFYSCIS